MNKIKVVSFYVARFLDFMIIAIPAYIIFQLLFMQVDFLLPYTASVIHTHRGSINIDDIVWTSLSRLIANCAQLIAILPFLGIIYFLSKVFHRYEVGEIFILRNARCYYQIGKLLFFDALLAQPLSGGLWVAAATLSNPVGQRYIDISIGTPNIMAIVMGLLVIFISWVMIEGSKIQDEQQLII